MKKTLQLAIPAFLLVSQMNAQIPITTVSSSTPPAVAPQPQLVPCVPVLNTLANTNWAFFDSGTTVAQIGTFSVAASGRISGTITTNSLGTIIERRASFNGSMDGLCLAGTNILAAGTLQISGGLSGQILTWSYPITATISGDRSVITYAVTSTTTLNLRQYGALNPSGTNGYAYNGTYATTGTAAQINGQLACPTPENSVLDTPFGYGAGARTQLIFRAGTGLVGSVTGNLNANNGVNNPQPVETGGYQVYAGCTGFTMNIPNIRGGLIVGSNFEGVFAAGDFSGAYILPTNADGVAYTLTRLSATPEFLTPIPTR